MVRRHRLLETFLVENLGYRWDEVHHEAEVLEHAVSDRFIARIDALLGHPRHDPHGDPIPLPGEHLDRSDAVPLSAVQPGGDAVIIRRVSDESAEMLRYFAGHGLTPARNSSSVNARPSPPVYLFVSLAPGKTSPLVARRQRPSG